MGAGELEVLRGHAALHVRRELQVAGTVTDSRALIGRRIGIEHYGAVPTLSHISLTHALSQTIASSHIPLLPLALALAHPPATHRATLPQHILLMRLRCRDVGGRLDLVSE